MNGIYIIYHVAQNNGSGELVSGVMKSRKHRPNHQNNTLIAHRTKSTSRWCLKLLYFIFGTLSTLFLEVKFQREKYTFLNGS
jgi:hypothetical protein